MHIQFINNKFGLTRIHFRLNACRGRLNNLHFDSLLFFNRMIKAQPLYPYRSTELYLLFVYGTDFRRHMSSSSNPTAFRKVSGIIVLFSTLVAINLCIARRRLNLVRSGLISSFIDTLVAFMGGGNLRMQHKFERWFFTVLMVGAFFMTALWTGELLSLAYHITDQKVNTFEQLIKINTTIYNGDRETNINDIVHEMLKFVLILFGCNCW